MLHKSIATIVEHKTRIISDVTLDANMVDITERKPLVKIRDRGSDYDRHYAQHEIIERNGEYPEEHICYKHIYFCTNDVPVEVLDALSNSRW
jgi:hypothetical protein